MSITSPSDFGSALKALSLLALVVCLIGPVHPFVLCAQDDETSKKLEGFDQYMEKVVKEWNAPGVSVGIVLRDKLTFAKGYGYRDYSKKLPMTPNTLFQIASNTKLFTSVAAGMLVEEGKLEWDKPVRQYVPIIQFYNDELNKTVTIRDMLAHRTGVTRHDMIWYKSDFTRKELFERLKYLEPSEPLRQTFLYNNLMYAASGYIIEYLSQKPWEDFLRARIFEPLGMNSTVFSVQEMKRQPDHSVPYQEKRDSTELIQIPHYEEQAGVGPAGSIISNVEDVSRWLIALMNEGKYKDKQIIPSRVLKATLEPAIATPNTDLEIRGYKELLNPTYGTGRFFASYRGHYFTYHGGAIGGCFSQISSMPYDRIGVIVLVIGGHCGPLPNIITYNIYERLLGLDQTPWSERLSQIRRKDKEAGKEARTKAGVDRVPDTKPSHTLSDYAGDYEHPAYGILRISTKDHDLQFDFHKIQLPLTHYHYDRFDTPDDELWGKWSVNFSTNPQGEVDKALMSLDQAEAVFTRKPDPSLSDTQVLRQYTGSYETPSAFRFQVVLKDDNHLYLETPGQPLSQLIPYKRHKFRRKEFSDLYYEFVLKEGQVTAMKVITPSGQYENIRK
jgi:CubicO group peptidase (beta-lactamase class C family)